MAFRRFRNTRRVAPRRRRMFRRRVARIPRRRFPNNTHSFKQSAELANVTVTAGISPSLFAYTFQLSDIPNASALADLYDQYRINAVKVTFFPQANVFNANTTNLVVSVPEIYTAIDLDSNTTPTSINVIDQYTTARHKFFNRPHSRYLKPKALGQCYISATSTGYFNLGKQWLDMGNTNIPHYGLVGGIVCSQGSDMVGQLIRVTATYYLQCRNVR